MKLKDGNLLIPFFGQPLTPTGGRDHLGMQRAAVRTYARLLPGLTNLTKRLRYYSFYCWLLEYYAETFNDTNPNTLKNFIRRSELLLAFINRAHDNPEQGVMGSDFVQRFLDKKKGQPITWKQSAELGGEDLYWKHSGGAFYQYYLGPMKELGLIEDSKHGLPVCSKFGIELARILSDDLNKKNQNQFHDLISKNQISVSDTGDLKETFALSCLTEGGREQILLRKYLFGPDRLLASEKSFFRKNSLIRLLNKIENNGDNAHSITESIFKGWDLSSFNSDNDETKVDELWWYYHLNEMGHYAAESIFWCFLDLLINDGSGYKQKSEVLKQLWFAVKDNYTATNNLKAVLRQYQGARHVLIEEICEAHKALEVLIKYGDYSKILQTSLCQLFRIYNLYVDHFPTLQRDLQELNCYSSGDTIEVITYLGKLKAINIEPAIQNFISKMVISKHAENVIRKIGSGSQITMKFIHEGAFLKGIETVKPRLTSPRIGSGLQFLRDIKLISDENILTDKGKLYVL